METDARAAEFEAAAAKLATAGPDAVGPRRPGTVARPVQGVTTSFVETLRGKARATNNKDSGARVSISASTSRARPTSAGRTSRASSRSRRRRRIRQQRAQIAALAGVHRPARRDARKCCRICETTAANNQAVRLPAAVVQAYVQAADGQLEDGVAAILEAAIVEQPRARDLSLRIGQLRENGRRPDGAIAAYQTSSRRSRISAANPVVPIARLTPRAADLKKGDTARREEQLDALLRSGRTRTRSSRC